MTPKLFMGSRYQKGHGLGGIFRTIARIAMPLLRRTAIPFLKRAGKSALKTVGRQVIRSGKSLVGDVVQGKPFKESVKRRTKQGVEKAVVSILKGGKRKQKGGGMIEPAKKKKKCSANSKVKKMVPKNERWDIFNNQ